MEQSERMMIYKLKEWTDRIKPRLWPNRWRCRSILRAIWRLQADTAFVPIQPQGENDIHTMASNRVMRLNLPASFRAMPESAVLNSLKQCIGRKWSNKTTEEIWGEVRFDLVALEAKRLVIVKRINDGQRSEDRTYKLTELGYDELCPWYQKHAGEIWSAIIGAVVGAIIGALMARN